MFKNEFDKTKEDFEKKRKTIKKFMIGMFIITIILALAQIGFVIYAGKYVVDNGGVQKTLTDIVRVVKEIDRDSEIPSK